MKLNYMTMPGIAKLKEPDDIISFVEKATGIDNIKKDTRNRKVVEARQIAMYVLRKLSKEVGKKSKDYLSQKKVGSIFLKEHATVIHAVKTVDNLRQTNKDYVENYNYIFNYFNL